MGSAMRLVILGGGGHGVVVAEGAQLSGWILEGFYDDDAAAVLFGSVRRLGAIGDFAARGDEMREAIVGVGLLEARRRVIEKAGALAQWANVIHPRAIVSERAEIGDGAFVGPGAIVNPRARVGMHAIINSGAIVEHDCAVGVNAHVAPGAVLCGGVRVGTGHSSAGARVIPGCDDRQGALWAGAWWCTMWGDGDGDGNPARVKKSVRAVA
ncbi:MAG: hypothetical protein R3B46_07820 [Phycisphaerales bacterium]